MAVLSPLVRHVLGSLTNGLHNCLYQAGDMGQEACWNWALTGFYHNAVWPSYMFDFVTNGIDPSNVLDHHGRSWFRAPANRQSLDDIQNNWLDAVPVNVDQARTDAVVAVMTLAAEANGLTLSAAGGTTVTPYRLFVEYKVQPDRAGQPDVLPSFHHVWIDVDGCAIEIFPGRLDIQIYRGSQPIGPRFRTWSCYLVGLHQRQVDRICKVLRLTRAHWAGVPAVPAARQAWIADDQRASCVWCGADFGVLRRRHHCRRCGEIFCSTCSDFTRNVANPATRPNSQASVLENDARVCVRCNG